MDSKTLERRVRNLPGQLERARRHVLDLEAEATRYRMFDLLTNDSDWLDYRRLANDPILNDPAKINKAWEDTVFRARNT